MGDMTFVQRALDVLVAPIALHRSSCVKEFSLACGWVSVLFSWSSLGKQDVSLSC